jgi:hypothetical protein
MIPPHLRRYAHIGVAAGLAVLIVGVILFRHSEDALHAVSLATFATAFGVFHFLDERNKRRERREGREPQ